MVSATPDFIAAGGNRHPDAADWDQSGSGLLVFGAGRNVALWRPQQDAQRGIQTLLSGHSDTVNAVKFLPASTFGRLVLVTGSADNSVRIWTSEDGFVADVECKTIPDAHTKSINAIAVLNDSLTFATCAADAEVKIWQAVLGSNNSDVELKLLQAIVVKPKFIPLTLTLFHLSAADSVALAVAGTKSIIQVYVAPKAGLEFKQAATLAGHEGWIRSLSFVRENGKPEGDLILTSASQDRYIRLWRFHQGETLPPASEAMTDTALGSIGKSLSNKAHRFEVNTVKFTITFEALLVGHEDWIYTTRWYVHGDRMKLLSASADNSMAMWELDTFSGVWVCTVRLGEISAQKGATTATGSTGGFWIGLWSPNGDSVVSLARTGAWRKWDYEESSDRWEQTVAVTGHTKEVQDISWAKDGSYLLSTSSDQTTRLFAEWKRQGSLTWHEFSRPQIHGYDLNCIDNIHSAQFVSGADEKLLRVFDEPRAVANLLSDLAGYDTQSGNKLLDTANIPVLGLSNKAVDPADNANTENDERNDIDEAQQRTNGFHLDPKSNPPLEDDLARHLLWPETEKLYGHGYEICAVAASNDGEVIATACRASSLDHAVIRLFETKSWREVKPPLAAHSLTVTSMEFSPDDKYLLSVGRDRQCTVFERDENELLRYKMLCANAKAHTRMILDCSWAPKTNETYRFATAGRDKSVQCWQLNGSTFQRLSTAPFPSPVTAVDFLRHVVNGFLYLACGCEDGYISLSGLGDSNGLNFHNTIVVCPPLVQPSMSISSLTWRPSGDEPENQLLAVASHDNSVRIYKVDLTESGSTE